MKIKAKLTLGFGLLFALIVLLIAVGAFSINALKEDTENILVANYNTLDYSRKMLSALEDSSEQSLKNFELNLNKQKKNITERGEQETTLTIAQKFSRFKLYTSDTALIGSIRKDIFNLMEMNMNAIQRKSEVAKITAEKSVYGIAAAGTICFLIAFILLINLPSSIANPIRELTDSIQQIAAKNYSERVNFESHSEFGQLAQSFNTMAKKLEEYNNSNLAKLMKEKYRIETLINNMHDPVIGLDEKLNVIFVNEEALKIIGLSKHQLIGFQAAQLAIKNDLIRTLLQDLDFSELETKTKAIKIYTGTKEGYFEKETLPISITPTGEQTKQFIGHVIILRNVTEYKEMDFAKTNFIATVSHEFKTPISSIKMSLQLLERTEIGDLNSEQRNLVESIKDDANRLLKITGELLNMTQVESGNILLTILPSDPIEILKYAINTNKNFAEQRNVKLEVHYADNLPKILADSEKTAWVLTNLISNAIRYSYDNSTVYISVFYQLSKLYFTVKDSGQGIEDKYKDKIFERYFRIPGTKREGTGLGLSISKEFIEAQGGQISVASDFGAGSTFTLVFNKVI